MPAETPPSAAATAAPARAALWAVVILAVVIGLTFWRSFEPGQALFSNDGPLGANQAASASVPEIFTGAWQDLNWVGEHQGSAVPDITYGLLTIIGAINYAKFYVPIALFVLGWTTWLFFRRLGFHPRVCVLGALASALNMNVFSNSCWGLASRALTLTAVLLCLTALPRGQVRARWARYMLAGLALGVSIMEGYDIGAIFSLLVAAYVVFEACIAEEAWPKRILKGTLGVSVVAAFSAFMAAAALITLIQTQIQGVSGAKQDQETKSAQWDRATQWSLTKVETLRVIIPGLFGYRMDTPDGGQYWGGVGREPGWEQTHNGYPRHSGSGEYAGTLVVVLALWGVIQTTRKANNVFTLPERRRIWFWSGMAVLSLLFAFGRHAPFYRLIYALPYFSTIRNPIKFMHPFHLCLLIVFGYALQGLNRRYIERPGARVISLFEQLKSWWANGPAFDKKWTIGAISAVAFTLLGWLLYASSRSDLMNYLRVMGFGPGTGPYTAEQSDLVVQAISRFSVIEVGWFALFLSLSIGALTVALSGALAGPRAKWAGIIMGLILVVDLGRANSPWIKYYNWHDEYASNPILDLLRDKPYEHRVAMPRFLFPDQYEQVYAGLFNPDWLQHRFQFYNIQSLDIIQMPRAHEDYNQFESAFALPQLQTRRWQLTNTRFLLGASPYIAPLNQQLDPAEHRFRTFTNFNLTQGSSGGLITVQTETNGPFALFEFTGALPRARLYANWKTIPDRDAILQTLSLPLIAPTNILNPAALAAKLAQGAAPAAVSQFLLTNLSASTQKLLFNPASVSPAELAAILAADLNHVVRSSSLYESARFAGVKLSAMATNLLASPNVDGAFLARLNWVLLTDAYPQEITRNPWVDPLFDPTRTVLVEASISPPSPATATNLNPGSVTITHYAPKRVELQAQVTVPSVLLLNDKDDPNWKLWVDRKPQEILRCNYLMRGVQLTPGEHTILFSFEPTNKGLYISLAAILLAAALCGFLAWLPSETEPTAPAPTPSPKSR